MHKHSHKMIKLDEKEWDYLLQLARQTNSRNHSGKNAKQVTVNAFMRRMGRGEFVVTEKKPNRNLERQIKALDEAIAENERRALPGQQPLFDPEPA